MLRLLLAGALLGGLAACGTQGASPQGSTRASAGAGDIPAQDELLPSGVEGATPWQKMASRPSGFDPVAAYADAAELAGAFGAAIAASYAGTERPELDLVALDERSDRSVLLVSETGLGDDAVAGTQYLLVAERIEGGWALGELWTRALCWRGVSGDLCV